MESVQWSWIMAKTIVAIAFILSIFNAAASNDVDLSTSTTIETTPAAVGTTFPEDNDTSFLLFPSDHVCNALNEKLVNFYQRFKWSEEVAEELWKEFHPQNRSTLVAVKPRAKSFRMYRAPDEISDSQRLLSRQYIHEPYMTTPTNSWEDGTTESVTDFSTRPMQMTEGSGLNSTEMFSRDYLIPTDDSESHSTPNVTELDARSMVRGESSEMGAMGDVTTERVIDESLEARETIAEVSTRLDSNDVPTTTEGLEPRVMAAEISTELDSSDSPTSTRGFEPRSIANEVSTELAFSSALTSTEGLEPREMAAEISTELGSTNAPTSTPQGFEPRAMAADVSTEFAAFSDAPTSTESWEPRQMAAEVSTELDSSSVSASAEVFEQSATQTEVAPQLSTLGAVLTTTESYEIPELKGATAVPSTVYSTPDSESETQYSNETTTPAIDTTTNREDLIATTVMSQTEAATSIPTASSISVSSETTAGTTTSQNNLTATTESHSTSSMSEVPEATTMSSNATITTVSPSITVSVPEYPKFIPITQPSHVHADFPEENVPAYKYPIPIKPKVESVPGYSYKVPVPKVPLKDSMATKVHSAYRYPIPFLRGDRRGMGRMMKDAEEMHARYHYPIPVDEISGRDVSARNSPTDPPEKTETTTELPNTGKVTTATHASYKYPLTSYISGMKKTRSQLLQPRHHVYKYPLRHYEPKSMKASSQVSSKRLRIQPSVHVQQQHSNDGDYDDFWSRLTSDTNVL